MHLHLYREPYIEAFPPKRCRLLFETSRTSDTPDFYLYVWIEKGRALAGFQAVCGEEFVAEYRAPAPVAFVRLGGRPVKRSVGSTLTDDEKAMFCSVASSLAEDTFPKLVSEVDRLIHGGEPVGYSLCDDEADEFAALFGKGETDT